MIKALSEEIEGAISSIQLPDTYPGLYDPISYTLDLGGKRIRPLLVLLGAKFVSDNHGKAMNQAIGLEIFHNFTLVHDDIMDDAPLRRGKTSVFKKWNSNAAILSGDVMFAISVDYISRCDNQTLPFVLKDFLDSTVKVCEGQHLDMNFELRSHVAMEDYLHMIELKTAWLLAASIKIGARIGGASNQVAEALFQYMMKAGTAFQLMDDYLDAYGDPDKFGKQVGGDILAGKKTFLFIRSLDLSSKQDHNRLLELYSHDYKRSSNEVAEVKGIFERSGAKADILRSSDELLSQSFGILSGLNGSDEVKAELINLTSQLINREK
ncbi:MAG: polyprenyl synthetase family protein [Vicingaceae bacterium]